MKYFIVSIFASVVFFSTIVPAFAHVVVRPNEVGVGAFQTFTVGVPVEKDVPTVGLRLVIPDGLQHVTPNVKPGWEVSVQRDGEGEEAKVTEITWTGGSIPAGQRDEFLFSAQVPASERTVAWKAYQTYEDGSVVAWDQNPSSDAHSHDAADGGPWSETAVVNDLAQNQSGSIVEKKSFADQIPLVLSVTAVLLSATALFQQKRRKK